MTNATLDYQKPTMPAGRPLRVAPQRLVLAGFLLLEIAVFSVIAHNFLSAENLFQVPRLNVELGLVALALTPVIVTGGIDLSVGSLLGLCAVLFGKMWRDLHLDPSLAAVATIAIGGLAGLLNASLITRLRIPPLIVTLGSMSLFRGIAEGMTRGVDNFTNFPASFLHLGQGYFKLGTLPIPAQIPIFIAAAVGFWVLLHRTTIGRAWSAIGFSPEGARHAGIPVERRVALAYVLSGLAAGLAAVIYVARVGQAKADAGLNYELNAVTAVVLGGTSIFGGRGSIVGTLMGLFAVAILQNGLRLADEPAEAAGVFTGLLLLGAIGLDRFLNRTTSPATTVAASPTSEEEFSMKNSQLAALCVVIVAAALIVAMSNYQLAKTIVGSSRGTTPAGNGGGPGPSGKKLTIAMMPKSKGNAYFIAAQKGANDAAAELGVNLIWDGPTDPDPAKQNEIVDTWVTRGVDAIAVACENRDGIASALRTAQQRGIKVVTWDSDSQPDVRSFFVNQATAQGIGNTLMDTAAKVMNGEGKFAIITASLTASNMNEWRKVIEARLKEKYPRIELVTILPCDDIQKKAFDAANVIMNKHADVKLIMSICSPAVPGAAEAVKQANRKDVKVIGLGLPNENKLYVHAGITEAVILWNTMDLGYLTVLTSKQLVDGTLKPGAASMDGGRIGRITIEGSDVLLGSPFVFTKDNIDKFDF